MTSPFNWQGQPSELAKSLQKDHVKSLTARGGAPLNTQTSRFHQFQKAVPNVFTPKA